MTQIDPYFAYPLMEMAYERFETMSGEESIYPYPCAYPVAHSEPSQRRTRRTRPLKVAHIGPSFVCAGVESWLRALVAHCDPAVLRFVRNVVTEDYAVDHELLQKLGIPCTFGRDTAVRDAVLESDVVLVWGDVAPEYLRPEGSNAKVIFVAHGVGDWTKSALEACSPVVDHVVAVSRVAEEQVCGGFPTTVILNGVDQRHIACRSSASEVRRKLGFSADDFVVGFAGRFSPEKNAHVLIEALRALGPDAKALLVGWGPLRYQLMELCNELIPGRFAFATSREFLGDYYQIMNALCMPSAEEGFGSSQRRPCCTVFPSSVRPSVWRMTCLTIVSTACWQRRVSLPPTFACCSRIRNGRADLEKKDATLRLNTALLRRWR
ncbi:MAG: glycosyltransferase [Planctomycetaceae bacterium]